MLEAFACGCPVILSKVGSLPEVGGDAVVYFDPYNDKSIVDAIRKVIYSVDVSSNLKAMGYEQLKKFSWEKTAGDTKAVYRSVL